MSSNSLFSTTETLGDLNVNSGSNKNVRHISGAVTLSGRDSGKLLSVSQSSNYSITLPNPTTNAGDSFHFINAGPGQSATHTVTISSNASNIVGSTNTNANAAGSINAKMTQQTCTFAPNTTHTPRLGDTLKFISNGTNYILTGNSTLDGFDSS